MTIFKKNEEQEWLDGAIRHLDLVCQEIKQYEDEGDIVPPREAIEAAKQLLCQLRKAPSPRIIVTVNGEIVLSWEIADNELFAIVAIDGSIRFRKNKADVEQDVFVSALGI